MDIAQFVLAFAAWTTAFALKVERWGVALEMLGVAVLICLMLWFQRGMS